MTSLSYPKLTHRIRESQFSPSVIVTAVWLEERWSHLFVVKCPFCFVGVLAYAIIAVSHLFGQI